MSRITKLILITATFLGINASATDTKILRITPKHIQFGQLADGESFTKTITLHNDGNSSLTIYDVYLHPYIEGQYNFNNNCSVIETGKECNMTVTFAPDPNNPPKNDIYSGLIYFVSDKTSGTSSKYLEGSLKSPSSTGTRILHISGDTKFDCNNTPSTKIITLKNEGNESLTINGVYLHPYIKDSYSFDNNCSIIEAGQECNMTVTFSPDPNNPPKNDIYSGLIYFISDKTAGKSDKYLEVTCDN